MRAEEIREGDIVEIDYIDEFTKEHINEGKALVIWKGFNHQPLVRKLGTKTTIWTCYEHIARVVGHIDIEGYMDKALNMAESEPQESEGKGMADIKLVINISEDSYKATCNGYMLPPDVENVVQGIKNGTPLPKGHGRLIDADKTISKICGNSCGCHLEECGHDKPCYSVARINAAPTIIETDKEQEE